MITTTRNILVKYVVILLKRINNFTQIKAFGIRYNAAATELRILIFKKLSLYLYIEKIDYSNWIYF
jgi:hypothetical protein